MTLTIKTHGNCIEINGNLCALGSVSFQRVGLSGFTAHTVFGDYAFLTVENTTLNGERYDSLGQLFQAFKDELF